MALFKFREDQSNIGEDSEAIKAGARILEPTNIVNVVENFAWTINPKTSRKDTPYIHMIERKITNDVMLQQLLYNIAATYELGNQGVKEFFDIIKKRLNINPDSEDKVDIESREKLGKIEKEKEETHGKFTDMFAADKPYQGLYDLEDTGWNYVFPYFDANHHNIGGNWGEPNESASGITRGASAIVTASGEVATGVNQIISALGSLSGETDRTRPGTYIERAKQYNFQPSGPSYSFTFNLLNTIKVDDVIRNWELCFALMYNLLPNRRTKTVFDPPPLYEIHIPGVRRSPISFIKGMRVDFVGATRLIDLSVAEEDKLRCIVPDAYAITIDIEDVLPESKNFMESMIRSEKRIRVSTRTEGETVNRDFTVNDDMSKKNDIIHISLNKKQTSGNPIDDIGAFGSSEPNRRPVRQVAGRRR